jgi:hypothetical protein
VSVVSFAPCRLNLFGISRLRRSRVCLRAPSLARRLLCSVPMESSWPLAHWSIVVADLWRRMDAAFLNSGAFFIPIQPWFSHAFRCVVRPSMAYLEVVTITRGCDLGVADTATIMAAISPTCLE